MLKLGPNNFFLNFSCTGSLLLWGFGCWLSLGWATLCLGLPGFSLWWLLWFWSTDSRARRLSSCGTPAQLLHGMWDPPRPGIEPVFPAPQVDSLPLDHQRSPHLHPCSRSATCYYSAVCLCSVPGCVQLFATPMDCSSPGSSVHGSQARILGWLAISFSRGSSQPKG